MIPASASDQSCSCQLDSTTPCLVLGSAIQLRKSCNHLCKPTVAVINISVEGVQGCAGKPLLGAGNASSVRTGGLTHPLFFLPFEVSLLCNSNLLHYWK